MVRRAKAVVLGAVVLAMAGACGDDSSKPKPIDSAGTSGDAGLAGTPDEPTPGGGAGAGGTRGEGGTDALPISGSAGEAEGGAPIAGSTDVIGQVVAGTAPVPGMIIAVNGIVVITDAEGRFKVRNVAADYRLMLRIPELKYVLVYEGLKTRAPRISLGSAWGDLPHSATVRGKLLGGFSDPPPDDDHQTISFSGKQSGGCNPDYLSDNNSFELSPAWTGDTTQEGEIWALQYLSNFNEGSYEYTGFGRKMVSFADMETLGSIDGSDATDVTLTDPDDVGIVTHTTVPDGWVAQQASLSIGPLSTTLEIPAGEGAIKVPKLDIPLLVSAQAGRDEGYSVVAELVPAQGPLNLVHRSPPSLSSPDNHAIGITTDTEFFWDDMPEQAIAIVVFEVGDFTVQYWTAEGSVKFPDLSPLHIRVPGQIAGNWGVAAFGPATTVEDALVVDDKTSNGTPVARFQTSNGQREFVTGE